jgi:hypothetical protein
MSQRIRKHLTPSTAIALLALVFALTGGAFAATSHGGGSSQAAVAAKVKPKAKPGPRGPAGPKGATGATGATGAAGATGATGPAGTAGAKGENGAAGTAGAAGPQGPQGPQGEKGEQGEPGEPAAGGGYPKTLPAGDTETGTFDAYFALGSEITVTPISFPIPLPVALNLAETFYVTVAEQEAHTAPSQCPGDAEKPTAVKGNLCVYEGYHTAGEPPAIAELAVKEFYKPVTSGGSLIGAGTTGALMRIGYEGTEEPALLAGDWAVTAP